MYLINAILGYYVTSLTGSLEQENDHNQDSQNKNRALDVIKQAWADPQILKWGVHSISATMVADKGNSRFQMKYFYQYFQILSILTIIKA